MSIGVPRWTAPALRRTRRFPDRVISREIVTTAGSDQALPDSFRHGLDPVLHPETDLHVPDDALDRAVGVAELLGDLLGVGAGGEERQDREPPAWEPRGGPRHAGR